MIAFGTAITRPDVYRTCAEPGIKRASEPDTVVFDLPATGSIFRSYNAVLDRASQQEGLEALVLVHQDAEIMSPELCSTIRATLTDPDVGLIGCVGAIGVRSIAWWEGSVTLASFINRYEEHGGGDLHSFSWNWGDAPPYARTGEVETLDGFVLVLSPWVVRNVRFDESLGSFHGYDLDFCLQVREAGRRVVTADFRAIHHRPLEMLPDPKEWIDAHMRVAEKWGGRMPRIADAPGTWRERALRAEAERDAARADARSTAFKIDAHAAMLEHALIETRESISWRITAPLRLLRRGRRAAATAERPRLGPDLTPPRAHAGRAR
jgi:Glycosyltransferase like family